MRMTARRAVGLGLLTTLIAADASAQKPLSTLRPQLEARIAKHKGVVGLSIIDLANGDTLSIRGHDPFPTASIIKLPILVELFHQMKNGRIRWEDPLMLIDADRVPGSGVLRYFSTPHQLTVGDAATLMTMLSDNTATNLIIDKLGIRSVNAYMDSLGLRDTRLFAKVFGGTRTTIDTAGTRRWGLGVTTANDLARLLAALHRGQIVSDSASKRMVDLLKLQFVNDRIPRLLPPGTAVAHKTGEVDATKNDCGIVYAKDHPFVLCALTNENADRRWVADNEALVLVAELSRLVYDSLVGGT
jgi:beta-lactamase class A